MELFVYIAIALLTFWFLRGKLRPTSRKVPHEAFPTETARRHLSNQIAEIDKELRDLTPTRGRAANVRASAQAEYVRTELQRIPIESIDVKGIGPRVFEALRNAGVRTIADIEAVSFQHVEGVGEERGQALTRAYSQYETEAERRFRALDDAELDLVSGGRLSDGLEDDAAEERRRKRRAEWLNLRREELLRRAAEARLGDIAPTVHPAGNLERPRMHRAKAGAVCPRCGGVLQLRRGLYGQLLACSNFPTCRYAVRQ